jgi:hypothetical protein
MQDLLQRLAKTGDRVNWGPFHFRVLQAPQRGQLLIEVKHQLKEGQEP